MSRWEDALDALARKERFGMRLGLGPMRAACAVLGYPDRAAPVLHVAGTNGKGTTAECLAALGTAHGLRTGLTTSPHLVELRERFRVDGRPLSADAAGAAWEKVAPVVEQVGMTFFEAATLIAFVAFRDADMDLVVAEVGLGGRLDATNVVQPDLSIVTNVGRDHQQHLGTAPAAIAREKAGIFKPGVPALVGDPGSPDVRATFVDVAREVGAPLEFMSDEVEVNIMSVEARSTRFDYAGPDVRRSGLEIPVAGAVFAADAALALRAWDRWSAARGAPVDEGRVRSAVGTLALPGRGQWVDAGGGVEAMLDVAHNPDAVERMAATLSGLGGRSACVVGVLADKAWEAMLDALEPVASRIWLCDLATAPAGRRLTESAAAAGLATRSTVEWCGSIQAGLAAARAEVAAGRAGRIVVTGSFVTVGEALVALGVARPGEPYAAGPRRPIPAAAR